MGNKKRLAVCETGKPVFEFLMEFRITVNLGKIDWKCFDYHSPMTLRAPIKRAA